MTKQSAIEALKQIRNYIEYQVGGTILTSELDIIETTLKDLDWLKEKLDLDFINRLSAPEDKIRLLKIMGYEFDLEASCKDE